MRRLIVEEPLSRAAVWSRRCGVFALLTAAVAIGVGRTTGERDPSGAFAVFGAALVLAMVSLLLAGAAAAVIWRTGRRGSAQAGAGFLLSLGLLAYPAFLTYRAATLPPINQVSTDLETPPLFMITSRAREARHGRNPPLADAATAAAQKANYPALQSMMVDLEPDQAYRMALRICKDLGWRLVDSAPPNLRGDGVAHVDAIDRSLFFGLPDDITIRIKPLTSQTKIDIRAVSRFGKHDFGANARRVARFIAAVQDSVQAR